MKTQLEADRSWGYWQGYQEGRRFGGCQAVLSKVNIQAPDPFHLKVMYVPQGFEAIDRGVFHALEEHTSQCILSHPSTMLQDAAAHRPDLVLVMNALHVFPPDHTEHIRQLRAMGIHTAVWFVDDPYFSEETAQLAREYDEVFTHELSGAALYKEAGCLRVHYLPLAADSGIFYPQQVGPEYQYDVCFIGNAFWNRVALIEELASFLEGKKVFLAGGHWDRLTKGTQLDSCIHREWIAPEETARYYNGAKIVINVHRPTRAGEDNRNSWNLAGRSINPRTYEMSACGTLQITDLREDLTSYYRPGYDIETFKDAAELQAKISYYLEHEEERLQMAWRSLWTTRQYHHYGDRVRRLLGTVSLDR